MKLFDNIKDFFFASDEDEEISAESPAPSDSRSERAAASAAAYNSNQSVSTPPSDYEEPAPVEPPTGRRNKVVNIQTTAQLQVVLVKPSAFTDAKQIADHLIAKKTVVLNLETASPENKRRIIDFLVGVAYANGGSLKPVANLTYIITPYNVGFIGEDLVGELENNGVFI
ncbi:MAG: cell division protein SepF [Ruminococcus flavefaciens]|nr:cell division protein SepF [Ruminococcus flavefaciens]MCM1229505.1 cell division protein SepF [Ruminococcus flavefaciens]